MSTNQETETETEKKEKQKKANAENRDRYVSVRAREKSQIVHSKSPLATLSLAPRRLHQLFHFVSIPISHIILGFLSYLVVSWYPVVVVVVE
jgi:hypothetical protein